MIADVQYADVDNGSNFNKTRTRYYRNSLNQLHDAIVAWNKMDPKPSFLLQLGDLLDGHNKKHPGMSKTSWDKMMAELSQFTGDIYHTFGNHDYYNFSHTELAKLLPPMTLPDKENDLKQCFTIQEDATENGAAELEKPVRLRYSFSPHERFLFINLDTYEVSMLGYNKDDPEYTRAKQILHAHNPNKVN